jgi:hypothetical protein
MAYLQPNNGYDPQRYPRPQGHAQEWASGRITLVDEDGEEHIGENEVPGPYIIYYYLIYI